MCCFCISKDTGAALDPPTPKFRQIDPHRKAKLDPPDQSPTTVEKVETASDRLRSNSTDTTFSYASSLSTTQLSREVSEPVGGTILAFMRGESKLIDEPDDFLPSAEQASHFMRTIYDEKNEGPWKVARIWQITPRPGAPVLPPYIVEKKGRYTVT
jgi:hypothetical protein